MCDRTAAVRVKVREEREDLHVGELHVEELEPAAERKRLAARVLLGERAALEACVGVWKEKTAVGAAA